MGRLLISVRVERQFKKNICASTPDARLTGPTRAERSVRQTSAEQQQMDGGCTPSNGHAFVAARSHSATVALTTPPWVAQSMRALHLAQRKHEARAAARRRLQGNPTRESTFTTWTVSALRLASCTRRSRERSHVPEDHPLSLRRASPPHDMPQRALARHPPATAARLPWLQPAGESMPATCCPRLPHG